jgi:hypothetical protein
LSGWVGRDRKLVADGKSVPFGTHAVSGGSGELLRRSGVAQGWLGFNAERRRGRVGGVGKREASAAHDLEVRAWTVCQAFGPFYGQIL